MEWQFVVALVIAIPIILFPAAFVWYLNIGGIYATIKEARQRRAAREKEAGELARTEQSITETAPKERSGQEELVGQKR